MKLLPYNKFCFRNETPSLYIIYMDTYSNKEKYYIILTLHIHISGKSEKSAFMKKVCVHLMNSFSSQSLLQVLNINHSCLREIRLFRHHLKSLVFTLWIPPTVKSWYNFFDVKQLFNTYGKDGFLGDMKLELLVEMTFMF